jgi:AAA ATPase containing von Willebrand factor type A (vWA) domain
VNKLDKTEYNLRLDQINALVEAHDIQGAIEIAETIDWRRVKSLRTLCMIADIYEAGKLYEESKDILILAYNRSTVGKAILYRLVEISVKLDQMDDAAEYYTEYAKNARGDSAKYLLKYKIYRARRAPLEEQAEILEKYKSKEYTERWAFELAQIYDRMGLKDKCIEECDDLILWFSEGNYVLKAMELKKKYEELSPMQQSNYKKMKETQVSATILPEDIDAITSDDTDLVEDEDSVRERTQRMTTVAKEAIAKRSEEATVSRNSEDLQERLANSFRDVLSGFNRAKENIVDDTEPEVETVDEPVDVDEYSVVKDLEPEELKAIIRKNEAISDEPAISDKSEAVVSTDEPVDTTQDPLSEEGDVSQIISEMTSTIATQVEDIQAGKEEPSDIGETREFNPEEALKLEELTADMSMEEQILREETANEKQLRILNSERTEKLTDDQKGIFSYFAKVPGMDRQLLDALYGVYSHASERTSNDGNIAIMGSRGTGKTRLFESIVKVVCKDLGIEATKIARINATQLNEKDPAEVISKMAGGFLLIEKAGLMDAKIIDKLSRALGFRTDSLILVIEDEKDNMRKLLADHKEFANKFKTVISIPVFTNDELVTFARTYAREHGYKVDEMGVLALYDLIGSKQSERDPITIDGVKEIMDKAMANTQKVSRKFGRKLAVSNTDEEGRTLIYEKDFY